MPRTSGLTALGYRRYIIWRNNHANDERIRTARNDRLRLDIGSGLPVILLSHGHGPSNNLSSLNGYAPLANLWAAHGFAVI